MSDLRVDFVDLPGFVAAFAKGPAIVLEEMGTGARVIALRGEGLSKVYAPVGIANGGNLRSTIYGHGGPGPGGVEAIWGASAEYAMVVEKGRGAGKPMPPKGVLLPFMAAAGIPEEMEFALRRSIGIKGIKARPFVGKAFDELKGGFIMKTFSDALARAIRRIGSG